MYADYTAKSQRSFVDSRRRDDTYGLRSLACIQSQSRRCFEIGGVRPKISAGD